jgi:anti-anti-sigma factor
MKNVIENKVLTIFFEGQLNSSNAEETEREIDEILSKEGFSSIKLDFSDLNYISSAGLRIVLRIKKQFDDTSIINVQENVLNVLTMVSFQNIIDIKAK